MAGGEGSRLRPLTCTRPKPMVPVANRPMMEHILELLKEHGLTEIGVTLQYLPQEIQDYFGDGKDFGVEMRYFLEEKPLGTAGSVKNAEAFLDETFIVISGDALTDIDLSKAIAYHKERNSLATLVLTRVEGPLEYGVVIVDQQGHVKRFLEKPSWGEVFSDTVNTGIYILEPEVLKYIPNGEMFDFSKDVFPAILAEQRALYGYIAPGYWCDIGNLQQYLQAHEDVLNGLVKIKIKEREIQPGVWLGENAYISPEAQVYPPVIVGHNCQIGAGVTIEGGVVLGTNTSVEQRASLKRCLTWSNSYLGKNTEIRGAILCNQAQVRNASALFEGAVVGDHTIIKERSVVKPEIKIWPYKTIEAGTLVQSSLIWGSRSTKSLFGSNGVSGEVNTEITPEFATRLGAAYGSLLPVGTSITVSSDFTNACQMLRNSLVTGLLSVGIKPTVLGSLITPMVRFAIPSLGAQGGIHVKMSTTDDNKVFIDFLDSQGANISRNLERKIENIFGREDFRRSRGSEISKINNIGNMADCYFSWLMNSNNQELLQRIPVSLLFFSPSAEIRSWVGNILSQLGCNVQMVELSSNYNVGNMWEWSEQFKTEMQARGGNFGVIVDGNGENMFLIDEKGNLIKDELFTILLALLILQKTKGKTVAVPLYAPQVVEELANRYSGQVVRTKTSLSYLMEQVILLRSEHPQEELDPFALYFDPLYGLIKIIEFIAENQSGLENLISSIPTYYLSKKTVECPWETKGKVMRSLIEEQPDEELELVEGVRIKHQGGWALVLPDADEPLCRIYGEGYSEEYADSLTEIYLDKIKELQKN